MPAGVRGHGESSPLGSNSRLQAALAYALAGFTGIVFLVLRREDRFVQFHSLQSIAITAIALAIWIFLWMFSFFPLLGFLYGMLLHIYQIGLFVLWIFLLYQAWRGHWYRIPYLGAWAERQVL
jgi:uncharacterized membrane protein